ncbi:MAG: hypothetical protein JNL32_05495 [Candidatus Kapabacteria bacterium]|nr:hypothetical protein [Candidatus Kapabacteria bacterium]
MQTIYGQAMSSSGGADGLGNITETFTQQQALHGYGHLVAEQSAAIASAMALRFVDRTAQRGKEYIYRVYSATVSATQQHDTAFVVVQVTPHQPLPAVESLRVEEQEREVVLRWEKYNGADGASGYWIEQSTNGGATFRSVNRTIYTALDNSDASANMRGTTLEYRVALTENYKPALYRIRAITPFGESTPPGMAVKAMGRDKTPPLQPILQRPVMTEQGAHVRWSLPDGDRDVAGFTVATAPNPEADFTDITPRLSVSAREYYDKTSATGTPLYYVVTVYDTAGNARSSIPLRLLTTDSIPPAAPTIISANVDSTGMVHIRWNRNTESDLKGYRVFYTNQLDHEWIQLTTDITRDTSYTTVLELNTLTKTIFYKVNALDENFNHSPFSRVIELTKPDIVAPTAPRITASSVTDSTMNLRYAFSSSTDVVRHYVVRRIAGSDTTAWIRIDSSASGTYADRNAESGRTFEYAVIAVDNAGLVSQPSNSVELRRYPVLRSLLPSSVVAVYDSVRSMLNLSWTAAGASGGELLIYASNGDDGSTLLASLPATATSYATIAVRKGRSYRFGIKVVQDDGVESAMTYSNTVTVRD